MLSTDAFFDEQAAQTLAHVQFGGADFGECMTTMGHVPSGDAAAWYREWTATADRVAAIGDTCVAGGHVISAREAYLRASNYYRTSYLMHYGAPPAAEVLRGFERESATFRAFALRADPGLIGLWGPMQKMFSTLPPETLNNPLSADPTVFAPYMTRINASLDLRWKIVQRGFWAHGINSLAEYLNIARQYTNDAAVRSIRCPVFLAWEENDPLSTTAPEIYEALSVPKTLVRFLAAEGAGDHCAMMGRSLFHQRLFDWLDDVLVSAPQKAR